MTRHRLAVVIRSLHAGQVGVLWVATLLVAFVLIRAHTSAGNTVSQIRAVLTTSPPSLSYLTPEQRVRADSFWTASRAGLYRRAAGLKTRMILVEFGLAVLAGSMLTVTWLWFGGRRSGSPVPDTPTPPPSVAQTATAPPQPAARWSAPIRAVFWIVVALLGLALFRLGEALMVWLRTR